MAKAQAAKTVLGHDRFYIRSGEVCLFETDEPVAANVQSEIEELAQIPTVEELNAGINAERKKRIIAGGIIAVTGTNGIPVGGRDEDRSNLSDLAVGAQIQISAGDTSTTTAFRDRENNTHSLTPLQIVELFQGGLDRISSLYVASWTIKAMNPIPSDYTDDTYWPDIV